MLVVGVNPVVGGMVLLGGVHRFGLVLGKQPGRAISPPWRRAQGPGASQGMAELIAVFSAWALVGSQEGGSGRCPGRWALFW